MKNLNISTGLAYISSCITTIAIALITKDEHTIIMVCLITFGTVSVFAGYQNPSNC